MSKKEQALKLFNNGYNCAQSVLIPFSDQINIDVEVAKAISSPFGGGMGRLQRTCGAVTGAFSVIGMLNKEIPDSDKKITNYEAVQKFETIFREKHGTSLCREILNCDLSTEEGKNKFEEENLRKNICEKCIESAIEILENEFIQK